MPNYEWTTDKYESILDFSFATITIETDFEVDYGRPPYPIGYEWTIRIMGSSLLDQISMDHHKCSNLEDAQEESVTRLLEYLKNYTSEVEEYQNARTS